LFCPDYVSLYFIIMSPEFLNQVRNIMKKFVLLFVIILLLPFIFCLSGRNDKNKTGTPDQVRRNGVAVLMTGAAARIPQEAALLEELDKRGLLKDLVFVSGVSSGSLNAVMLNGILSGKTSWDEYKDILFNLTNSDVFTQSEKKIPVDTSPLRELLKKIVEEKLGYKHIGDLPFTTEISFTHIKDLDLKKTVYRMCSRKINEETDTTLSLVDIMMASTAFPIAFPPVRIKNATTIPDVEFIDGGVGDDHVPYQALLEFEKFRGAAVEKVYVISRKSDSLPEISEELKGLGINDRGVFDKLGLSLDAILLNGMIKRLEAYCTEAPDLVEHTYIWVPDFKADFLLFNFTDLKRQYDLTSQWAKTHQPVPLSEYLLQYAKKKKE
jgi:predicted acylesterase/phospholipase RssA